MVQTIKSIYQIPTKKPNIKKEILYFLGGLGATLGIEALRYESVFEEIVKEAKDYGFIVDDYNVMDNRIIFGGLEPDLVQPIEKDGELIFTNKFNLDGLLLKEGAVGTASGLLMYIKKLKKIAPVLAGITVGEMLKIVRISGINMNFYHVNPGDPNDVTNISDPLIYVAVFHKNIAGTSPFSFGMSISVGVAGGIKFAYGIYKEYKRVPKVDYKKLGDLSRLIEKI